MAIEHPHLKLKTGPRFLPVSQSLSMNKQLQPRKSNIAQFRASDLLVCKYFHELRLSRFVFSLISFNRTWKCFGAPAFVR